MYLKKQVILQTAVSVKIQWLTKGNFQLPRVLSLFWWIVELSLMNIKKKYISQGFSATKCVENLASDRLSLSWLPRLRWDLNLYNAIFLSQSKALYSFVKNLKVEKRKWIEFWRFYKCSVFPLSSTFWCRCILEISLTIFSPCCFLSAFSKRLGGKGALGDS